MKPDPKQIADDVVVRLDYTLTVDGEVIDSSVETGPIEFIQGTGHIIPGLEKELNGMEIDEAKEVDVAPEDGYGEINPDAMVEIPINEFPTEIPVEPGTLLQVRDGQGNILDARIESVIGDRIRLDFNHPLAGKELHFSVKVVSLRNPSEEEIAHGHVHSKNGHYSHDE